MLYNIAELIAQIPTADGLDIRCRDYLYSGKNGADITIRTDLYRKDKFNPSVPQSTVAYMESAYQFYVQLVNYNGFFLHASAVVKDGKAYLFSGHSGAGKSTHTRLWIETFGADTRVINDDKPALRCIDGVWYAYGTPWCGKDGINLNEKAPVAGLCFLKKANKNAIRRLSGPEALTKVLSQTITRFDSVEKTDLMASHLDLFLQKIPVFELENLPEQAAARLSYETMSKEASL